MSTHDHRETVSLTPDQLAALERLATREDRPLSPIARSILAIADDATDDGQ